MQQNVITYNLNTVEILLDKYSLEPLAMYYLLKVVFVNSIIYSTDIHEIFVYLKSIKAIPRNYKYSDFQEAINNLIESEYLFINEYNHFQISNIKKDRGYYKSKVRYNKNKITLKIIKSLLVKEGLLHSAFRQEKAMKLRRDLTTDNIKTYKDFKRARRLKKKGERFNGESYSNLTTFTYRNFANKYGLSLSSLHDLVDLLKKSNQIGIKTVTKLYKKPINCNPKFIKDLIKLKSYFYFDSKNRVVAVLGSQIIPYPIVKKGVDVL